MKEQTISKEEQVALLRGSRLQDLKFPDLNNSHFKLLKLEEEFIDSLDRYAIIDDKDYKRLYLRTDIGNQARILMTLDLRVYDKRDEGYSFPLGTWNAVVMLASEERSGRATSNNNGEILMRNQWAVRICEECGEYFSTAIGGKNSHAKYCSKKCKRRAEHKRRKAKKKIDPITHHIKNVKSYIRGIEELSTEYPHFINNESLLQELQATLEQLENEQF